MAYEEAVLSERLGPLRPVVEALLRKSPDERPSAATARSALCRVAAGRPTPGHCRHRPCAYSGLRPH
ncbi:hypothetical protein HEP87_59560 [Streptomyces sp. S1D4-11]